MTEWWLIGCFFLLTSIALILLAYPLRKSLGTCLVLFLFAFVICVMLAYQQWGAWPAFREAMKEHARQNEARAMLAKIKSPDALIDKLKAQLDTHPESARGWYLLGRIYASQNQWNLARDAFAKSTGLKPDDELFEINYVQSLWQLNNQQFNDEIQAAFKKILAKNPNQPDALAMLAMDAYQRKDYQLAKNYWEQLLKMAPEHSKEANALRKAIAKANNSLGLK